MRSLSRHINERRGVATVLVVGVLVFFLIAFIVLAIDLSFIYVVRGELQNAADAAALAGASVIEDPNDPDSVARAKAEAKKFALKNYAASEGVVVDDDDITVGVWDGGPEPKVGPPFNAVKVVARRTGDNPVPLFFGRIIGKTTMEVSRVAIAANPARAEAPIALCFRACESGMINTVDGTRFFIDNSAEENDYPTYAVAYTDFSGGSVSIPSVVQFFCGKLFNACDIDIDTTTGALTPANRQFRCAFINPTYDNGHKICVNDANGNDVADPEEAEITCTAGSNVIVKSWTVLIPLVGDKDGVGCPSSYQPYGTWRITGYARAKITNVLINPGGSTGSSSEINCACRALGDAGYEYIKSPPLVDGKLALIINSVECVTCDSSDIKKFLGRSPYLVK